MATIFLTDHLNQRLHRAEQDLKEYTAQLAQGNVRVGRGCGSRWTESEISLAKDSIKALKLWVQTVSGVTPVLTDAEQRMMIWYMGSAPYVRPEHLDHSDPNWTPLSLNYVTKLKMKGGKRSGPGRPRKESV